MDERLRFIARLLEGEKMAVLCREFEISRKTCSPQLPDHATARRRSRDGVSSSQIQCLRSTGINKLTRRRGPTPLTVATAQPRSAGERSACSRRGCSP